MSESVSQIIFGLYRGDLLKSCILSSINTFLHHLTEFRVSYIVTTFRTLWRWSA